MWIGGLGLIGQVQLGGFDELGSIGQVQDAELGLIGQLHLAQEVDWPTIGLLQVVQGVHLGAATAPIGLIGLLHKQDCVQVGVDWAPRS